MTALVERGGTGAAHGSAAADAGGDWSPPTPDEQAAAAAKVAAAARRAELARRGGREGGKWSPPAPPGLPPGYRGPLLRNGATAVPPVPGDNSGVA